MITVMSVIECFGLGGFVYLHLNWTSVDATEHAPL